MGLSKKKIKQKNVNRLNRLLCIAKQNEFGLDEIAPILKERDNMLQIKRLQRKGVIFQRHFDEIEDCSGTFAVPVYPEGRPHLRRYEIITMTQLLEKHSFTEVVIMQLEAMQGNTEEQQKVIAKFFNSSIFNASLLM